ncbi:MAG: hypothetical protein ACI9W4_001784 [Rhodothermales bacterium]|jgi:hypothetical protein
MPISIVIIILAGITGTFSFISFASWLGSKEKQAKIGSSTGELGQTVAAQQKALEVAERRIQNLEAIVTSLEWDAVAGGALPEVETNRALGQARVELDEPEEEPSDTERAAQIAGRLKT